MRAAEVARLRKMLDIARAPATASAASTNTGRGASGSRAIKIGAAAAVSGVVLFATGGIAAPAVAAALGMVSAGFVALESTALISLLLGAAGAGLGGYTIARRTSTISEFFFRCGEFASSAANCHVPRSRTTITTPVPMARPFYRPLGKHMAVPGELDYLPQPDEVRGRSNSIDWRLEWMWADAGLWNADVFNKAAKANPLRWTSGSPKQVVATLLARDADRKESVLVRTKRGLKHGPSALEAVARARARRLVRRDLWPLLACVFVRLLPTGLC